MKILFAFHSSRTVGAERSLLALAEAAAQRGDEIIIVLPRPGPLEDLIARSLKGSTVIIAPSQWWMSDRQRTIKGVLRTGQALVHALRWIRLLARVDPHLVLVGSVVTPAPMIASRVLAVPVVVLLSESIKTNPTLQSVIPKSLLIWIMKFSSTATVAVSSYAAEQYNGADMIEWPALDSALRAPFPTRSSREPDAPLRCVMLGTLSREKGQLDAARAVAEARQSAEITLDLYGDTDDLRVLEDLKSLVAYYDCRDSIQHRGSTPDPLSALRQADVALVCSLNEAYGRVTAEALRVGTPVIGYHAGATPEIIEGGGGMLVHPTANSLADALIMLATDDFRLSELREEASTRAADDGSFGDARRALDRISKSAIPEGEVPHIHRQRRADEETWLLVVVTYRSLDMIEDLLSTISLWLDQRPGGRVSLVENSGDQRVADLARKKLHHAADRVAIDVAASNVGFAPAVNGAVATARKNWGGVDRILLLNPDVTTDATVLDGVFSRLDDARIGVVAPRLVNEMGVTDRGVARRRWNRRRLLAEIIGTPRVAMMTGTRPRNISVSESPRTKTVDITSGAFMAFRDELFGPGLDTRLPMYLEDQEMCARARRAGLSVVVDQSLVASHAGAASRKLNVDSARRLRMMELAMAPALSLADESRATLRGVRLLVLIGGTIRYLLATILLWFRSLTGAEVEGAWAEDQRLLAGWFISWARGGMALEESTSL